MSEWVDLFGFEGRYEISKSGQIRAIRKSGKRGNIRRIFKSPSGYLYITLKNKGVTVSKRVHRLVYASFVGEILSGMEINHINNCKTDNRLENLECVTRSQNMLHHYRVIGGRLPDISRYLRNEKGSFIGYA